MQYGSVYTLYSRSHDMSRYADIYAIDELLNRSMNHNLPTLFLSCCLFTPYPKNEESLTHSAISFRRNWMNACDIYLTWASGWAKTVHASSVSEPNPVCTQLCSTTISGASVIN